MLLEHYGDALPQNGNLTVAMVEAMRHGLWAPNQADSNLHGTTINYGLFETKGNSTHATEVAKRFFGLESPLAGISEAIVFEANAWLFLVVENGAKAPLDLKIDLINHSWISNTEFNSTNITKRIDYMIDALDVFQVVGIDNASGFPTLLANSFNALVVGISSGNHSEGGTIIEEIGRLKPDIVADETYTSYATPNVSSITGLLMSKAKEEPGLSNALKTEAMKAILMAGARKTEFANWEHSPNQPLDSKYGAGEVDIYRSFDILVSGESKPNSPNNAQEKGWDFNQTESQNPIYFFQVPEGKKGNLSAILTWHRKIATVGEDWTQVNGQLANLDLRLWRSEMEGEGLDLIYESKSDIDNVEHIYEESLPSGLYYLEVETNHEQVEYGIAWRTDLENTPLPDIEIRPASGISKINTRQIIRITPEFSNAIVVGLSGVADGSSIMVGEKRIFRSQIYPNDYQGLKTQLLIDGQIIETTQNAQARYEWQATEPGSYEAQVLVTNGIGAVFESKQILFEVVRIDPR